MNKNSWSEVSRGINMVLIPLWTIVPYNSPAGWYSQVGVGLFSQVTRDRTRENSLKFHYRRFRFDIIFHFFVEKVLNSWDRLFRAVEESLSIGSVEKTGRCDTWGHGLVMGCQCWVSGCTQ